MHPFTWSKILTAVVLAALFVGCESAFDTRPITEKYSSKLENISLGMSRASLKQVLPKAHLKGQNLVGGMQIDAYELIWRHTEHMRGDRVTERLWFYFYEDKLVRWGEPHDWPSLGDITVHVRRN